MIWTRGSKYDRLTHRQAALLIESYFEPRVQITTESLFLSFKIGRAHV